MKKAILLLATLPLLSVTGARAQTQPDLARFEWIGGLYLQGTMASAAFSFDTTPFGGILVERDGGTLDVDPTFCYGIRTNYRLTERWSANVSWMHAQAGYRVQFPAESRDEGNFDLEGLILGLFDLQQAQIGRLSSAAANAMIDTYQVSARYEIPILNRWAFPYVNVGTGIYRQKSDDFVFRSDYEHDPPAAFQALLEQGVDPLEFIGISRFAIDSTDWLVTVGAGFRASLSQRWGVDLGAEDVIQIGADYSDIDGTSTPPPDPDNDRLFSTTFRGKKGMIHSLAVRVSLNYSFWPWGVPR